MPPRRASFGEFVLDHDAGELTRAGVPVPLMRTEHRLLLYFVENPQRLLTKEQILDNVWPDTHVTEASLARAVATLRHALGDDAREPKYIETLPRRGYKFISAFVGDSAPAASRFRLFSEGRVYPLRIGDNVLGRGPESVVPIDSTGVSRRHAIIVVTPDEATLVDLHSTNGTFLRDARVEERVTLVEGDDIRIGPVIVTFTTRQHIAEKITDAFEL